MPEEKKRVVANVAGRCVLGKVCSSTQEEMAESCQRDAGDARVLNWGLER